MAYDIHGVWDSSIKDLGPHVKSHTNIAEIELALKIFFKNGVPPSKLVMGTGAYGRTFTLADPSCV
jgi:chitinase